ncbi:zinc finger protein 687a [Diretmus argenteus]
MGDMKTPDFDDLLAAFDIPDIDAKEAIQSSPEEEGDGVENAMDMRESGSPSCFPCSPASQSDPPVVSVIVKNIVRPESYRETERPVSDDTKSALDNTNSPSSSGSGTQDEGKLGEAPLTSQRGPKVPDDVPLEPQMHNGFEGSVPRTQGQSNGELWPSSPLRSTLNSTEGAEVGSVRDTPDIITRLKPLLYPQPLTSTPFTPSSSSSSPSPLSVNQHHPPRSTQKEDTCHLHSPPSSPPPHNGSMRAQMRHIIESDEEDSEPDLGSPLVIQESPESLMSSPPKLTQGLPIPSEVPGSAQTSPRHLSRSPHLSSSLKSLKPKPRCEDDMAALSSPSTPSHPQGGSTLVQEEKYPEHVIDERDSPESPPPDQTGFIAPKRSPSSASTPKPVPAAATNHECLRNQEQPRESEHKQENRPEEVSEVEGEKMETRDGGKSDKVNSDASSSSMEARSTKKTKSSSSRPLKVKIKTVKTPTGSITRTVTGVAPKSARGASSKGVDGTKPSPGRRTIVRRPKREVTQQSKKWKKAGASKADATLPAGSMPQDASTVKDKIVVDTKPKVSPTAVSITKTAALPSVSPSPRITPGGISMCGLGQKTLSSGMTVSSPAPLLPPQGSSRPASIVNSTGATISKSQSNLVEAFNKILNSKNLLPSYKPDLTAPLPAEWGLNLPTQGYRCLECGDAFALKQSLARHYDRRSLRIEVTCNHCAKRLAFFNKCSLLLHAREHKEKGQVMQCSHLVMKPVTVEQMIGQQEPTPVAPSSSSLLNQSTPPNPAPQLHQTISGKKVEALQYTSNKCPECQVQFCSKEEVAAHFQEIKAAHVTSCTECSPPMLLPNSCSSAAHQRIHQAASPHVCPECGGTAKQPAFQTHLNETCLHFARRIGYRCSSCQVVFGGLNSVKSHIQLAHCDMFHKCPSCPMAFKSASSIQNHINAQHPTLTGAQAKLIYKCVMCDTVFTQKSLLYVHFDTHLSNQKMQVFKCPECTKLYSQRSSLMDHIKSHKAPSVKQELPPSTVSSSRSRASVKMESSDGEECRDQKEEEKVNGERTKSTSGWNCVPCHARYTEKEDFVSHMAEQHGKILKKFPCNKCESSFTTTSSMRRHIRDKHKGMNHDFHCQFCTGGEKTFSSRVMLQRHIQLRHSGDAVSQDTQLEGGGGLDEADSSSEQDGSSGTRQRLRRAVKTEQAEESSDGVSPAKKFRLSSSSSSLPESGFRCAPCGFTTEDQAAFLEHIPQHRTGGTGGVSLQCLQCGACFTSTTSLSRHRFITHKVRNTFPDNRHAPSDRPASSPGNSRDHDDVSPGGGSPPASPSSQPSIAQGKEGEGTLACKVCGKHFEKTTDLNTHFRTHGMAFINARNTGKST